MTVLVLVVAALAGGAVLEGAAAKRPKTRVVESSYAPDPYYGIHVATPEAQASVTRLTFETRPGERAVEVELRDEVGERVGGRIYQGESFVAAFCGATEAPVEIDPSQPVSVWAMTGPCAGGPGLATQGTARVTFLRRPSR
ncbi:MAG: hypothetical protein ABR613_09610 [Actinomycetota bacterium]